MFTLEDIAAAHKKVRTGANFPQYARDLIAMGVTAYDTHVSDGHVVYLGNTEPLISGAKYALLTVAEISDTAFFLERLHLHQSGGTDYMTFCQDTAKSGIEKWTLDMITHTCTYYEKSGNPIHTEHLPE